MNREIQIQKPFIDQAAWGHPSPYPDGHWVPYEAMKYLLHYGGGGPYFVRTKARAFLLIRGWRRYHMESKDMRDIAYGLFAWRKMIRLRGLNQNGAHRNSNVWGKVTLPVVFPVGPGEEPTKQSLEAFARQWLAYPLPVTDHGSLPDQYTQCAGTLMKGKMRDEFWLYQFELRYTKVPRTRRRTQWAVMALTTRLANLGYSVRPDGRWFNKRVRSAVRLFQADRGLPINGRVGPDDLRELGKDN